MTILATHQSPLGVLTLTSDNDALTGIYFEQPKHWRAPSDARSGANAAIDAARRQLDSYFAGKRRDFDLALAPRGTLFQRQVWDRLLRIPFGATRTYGEIAAEIGAPAASRAVGAAVGRNPCSIVIPCHRVLGANGAMTGFAGGLARKSYLIALERGAASSLCA